MKRFKVVFRPLAEADLVRLYRYIAEDSGRAVADAQLDRIEATCVALETFPERGTRRDDIRPGLRILGFERRVAIAYQITKSEVMIVRIFYGGRDYEYILRGPAGD